jgi:hypothetical protein
MSIKTYLQKMVKLISSDSGKPVTKNSITLVSNASYDAWTKSDTYTAPANGWLRLTARSNKDDAVVIIESTSQINCFVLFPWNGAMVTSHTPVRKGDTFTFSGRYAQEIGILFYYDAGQL